MVKKLNKLKSNKADSAQLAGTVKESAQQIWLAGMGAFHKAQSEGTKVFETLVKEGLSLQRRTQAGVEERVSEVTNKMANLASEVSGKATGQWDKLEGIFEERVAKALNKLGVPSSKDIEALVASIDELNKAVQKSAKAAAPKVAMPKVAMPKVAKAAPKAAAKVTKAVKAAPAKVAKVAKAAQAATKTVKAAVAEAAN
jgi:poly(hydroxyalkanoate) granule-associated protein